MVPLLAIHHFRKKFAERLLFDIELFQIKQASAYVLTGANGTGKSTLLRILAGLERAEIGAAYFLGEPVQLNPYPKLLRNTIGYVHQHPIMFSTSVENNIGYGLRMRGVSSADIARQVQEAMEWAGVTHLRKNNTATLSGGEKQRIALARAKVLQPKLLLLDEPTSSLDGAAREQVIALIPNLVEAGSTVIMACHDRDLITLPNVQRLKLHEGHLEPRMNQPHSRRA